MKDIGMMMSGIEAYHREHGAADQEHYQPQLEGDSDFRRYQTHR